MASPAKGFKSENGKWFDTALEAWTEDLDQWLARSIENVAERGKIAKGIREDIENGNHLSAIIAGLKAHQPGEDVVERVATVLAPFVCRPVHNGDCDDIAAGQSHARYVARAAIAAMQENPDEG